MSAADSFLRPPRPRFPGTLNVFLHGLIGVLNTQDGIELLIPDVGPEHAYRFGEFLGEVTLPPSPAPYHITGVHGRPKGTPRPFPEDEHLCTRERRSVCAGAALYARIKLPHPLRVHSYLKVELTDVIEDPFPHLYRDKTHKKIFGTMTPVLEYAFDDPRDVLFGSDTLNVAPIWSHHHWYMNLHIFAEEDLEHPENHTIGGFDAIAKLFDFESAPRLISVSNIPPARKDLPLPPGTTNLEFLSLALRTRELGYLGRRVRFQLLNDRGPAIVQVSSVGGDPITCLPLISQ